MYASLGHGVRSVCENQGLKFNPTVLFFFFFFLGGGHLMENFKMKKKEVSADMQQPDEPPKG